MNRNIVTGEQKYRDKLKNVVDMGGGQPSSVAIRSQVNKSLEDINVVTRPATIEGH